MSQPIIKPRKRTLAPSHKVIDHETLVAVLSKPHKTTEEAKTVFEKIVSLSFFKNFFAFYLQDNDMSSIFSLCQRFQYEKFSAHDVILKQKDPSNDKFYVILSGSVGVFIKNDAQDLDLEKEAARRANEKKNAMVFTRAEMRRAAFQRTSKKYNTTVFGEDKGLSSISSPKSLGSPRNPRTLTSQRTIDLSEMTPKMGTKPSTMHQFGFEGAVEMMEKTRSACTLTSLAKTKVAIGKLKKTIAEKEAKQVTFRTSPHTLQDLDEDSVEGEEYNKARSLGGEDGEKKEFEKVMRGYGKLIRYMKEGEGFGELALKRNIARTTSVVCRSDCEVLVMMKEQYDQGFGKMHREKEDLLNSVFPFMVANAASTQNYNHLLYSFKTERYQKGAYIINEGRAEKGTKFYVIQKGECHVEKQLVKEISDGAQKTLAKTYEKVQLTVSGKGVVIGEEILITGNEYEYSIKAATDMVIVQAITKHDFEQKFPKEFQQHIKDTYEKKKAHREAGLAQSRKDKDLKILQYKTENVYCLQNRGIKDFLVKPAIQGFSKYLHRGNKLWDDKDPVLAELHSPLKKKNNRVFSLAFDSMVMQNEEQGNAKSDNKRSQIMEEEVVMSKEKEEKDREVTELLNRFGVSNSDQDKRIKAKIKFINIMTEKNKKKGLNESNNPFALNLSYLKLESPRNVTLSPTKTVKEKSSPREIPATVEKADVLLSKIRVRNQGPVLGIGKFEAELPKSARIEGEAAQSKPRVTSQEFESLYNQKIIKGLTKAKTPLFGTRTIKEPRTATSLASTDLPLKTVKSDPFNPFALESVPSTSSMFKLDLELTKSVSSGVRQQPSSLQYLGEIKEGREELSSARLNLEKCFGSVAHSRKGSDPLLPIATVSARGETKEIKTTLTPRGQVKTPRSPSDMHLHLREVKQWREKIFKKPGKVTVQVKTGSFNTCR